MAQEARGSSRRRPWWRAHCTPAWEAARNAKEKQALAAQAFNGQALGRKITFD